MQRASVIRKLTGLQIPLLNHYATGHAASQLIVNIGMGSDGGTHVNTDWHSIKDPGTTHSPRNE